MAKRLLQELVWPAAAGNVAWALFTIAIQEPWSQNTVARVLVLIFLAIYLAVEWLRIALLRFEPSILYWIFDGVHILTIVVFAIATQLDKPWLLESLVRSISSQFWQI